AVGARAGAHPAPRVADPRVVAGQRLPVPAPRRTAVEHPRAACGVQEFLGDGPRRHLRPARARARDAHLEIALAGSWLARGLLLRLDPASVPLRMPSHQLSPGAAHAPGGAPRGGAPGPACAL